jgi:hypothetical protein
MRSKLFADDAVVRKFGCQCGANRMLDCLVGFRHWCEVRLRLNTQTFAQIVSHGDLVSDVSKLKCKI